MLVICVVRVMTGTSTRGEAAGAELRRGEQDGADRADRGGLRRGGNAGEDRAEDREDEQHRRDQHREQPPRQRQRRGGASGSGGSAGDVFGRKIAIAEQIERDRARPARSRE